MMFYLKYVLFLVSFVILVSLKSDNSNYGSEIWIVKSSSSLKVDGKTNINSFSCFIPAYGKIDTLVCDQRQKHSEFCRVHSILSIPVVNFDCHHKMMTKDLQKTLKSDMFPSMIIEFKSFSLKLSETGSSDGFDGKADIKIAGVVKEVVIQFTSKFHNMENLELTGTKTINFSDFNLKPPSKLGGAIKVKDELDVEVKLQLKRIT